MQNILEEFIIQLTKSLVSTVTDYATGDGIDVRGTLSDGSEFAATFLDSVVELIPE